MNLEQWNTLRPGMWIYSKSNVPREVLKFNSVTQCATLKAVRKCKYGKDYTIYDKQCARLFELKTIAMKPGTYSKEVVSCQSPIFERRCGAFDLDGARAAFANGSMAVYCVRVDKMKVVLTLNVVEAEKFYE
jgi:hypothetical protein